MNSAERHEARYSRRKAKREEKRVERLGPYDDFNRVTNIDNLFNSFKMAMKGVRWKESVQRYESNALKNIIEARNKLLSGENVQPGFMEFDLNERGKARHIRSVHFSERVIQKCLCDQVVVPILTNSLIYDNGASIKNKGVHFMLRRLISHLSKFYRQNGHSNDGYALMIDFSKFFDSVNHEILFGLLHKEFQDEKVKKLLFDFVKVFGDGISLGLGSQVSQVCALFLPNVLDHFIKEKLMIKYYARYMDDLYLIHWDKEYLKYCLTEVYRICKELKISINMKKTQIVPLRHGLIFLKGRYQLLETGKILKRPCKGSTKRMRHKLKKFKILLEENKMSYDDLRAGYQSWRGNFRRRFDAYHQLKNMDKLYNSLIHGH